MSPNQAISARGGRCPPADSHAADLDRPPAWLRERCRSGPFTTRGLAAELLARGIKTDRRARLVFVRAEGLSFKKNRAAGMPFQLETDFAPVIKISTSW